MNTFRNRLFELSFVPVDHDLGLLVLRLTMGVALSTDWRRLRISRKWPVIFPIRFI
jgi:hypothetical protein